MTIVYNKLSNESIVAHSNSDWAQDPESHKFMTGYFTLMAHEITSQISYQQKIVKYMALSNYGHQLVWMKSFLNEVPTPYIYSDNLSSLFWRFNPIQEKCSKHIEISVTT